jgi:protein-L-isoaspartate(D-aspartate) O-methyltransferase
MFKRQPPPARRGEGMAGLVRQLREEGYLKTPTVSRAMQAVDRAHFVPAPSRAEAYVDTPLSIGLDQTISAPHMVAIMVEALEATPGMKVLEVGGGSGWHAAVIAGVVAPGGVVVSVERLAPLAQAARENLERAGLEGRVRVVVGDGSVGYPQEAPFDRISVAAAAPAVPPSLVDQLSPEGGRLVVPVGSRTYQELMAVTRHGDSVRRENLGGCVFVPLLGAEGFS